jgi:hypothetical protein
MSNTCKTKCDDGWLVPLKEKDYVCKKCDKNCKTCVGTDKHCLTCDKKKIPFLSFRDNTCHGSCPKNLTVLTDKAKKYCSACDDNCKTCFDKKDFCMSCKPGYSLFTQSKLAK